MLWIKLLPCIYGMCNNKSMEQSLGGAQEVQLNCTYTVLPLPAGGDRLVPNLTKVVMFSD